MSEVECPRCGFRLNARLHAITATDAQECPRCKELDDIEIPMFLMPREGAGRREGPRPPRAA